MYVKKQSIIVAPITQSFRISGSVRKSPYVPLQTNVSSALHGNAAFQITVQAYPVPSPDNFTWLKCVEICEKVQDNGNIIIQITDLKTELYIQNVGESDAGQYKLVVTNGIGDGLEQNFFLSLKGTVLVYLPLLLICTIIHNLVKLKNVVF